MSSAPKTTRSLFISFNHASTRATAASLTPSQGSFSPGARWRRLLLFADFLYALLDHVRVLGSRTVLAREQGHARPEQGPLDFMVSSPSADEGLCRLPFLHTRAAAGTTQVLGRASPLAKQLDELANHPLVTELRRGEQSTADGVKASYRVLHMSRGLIAGEATTCLLASAEVEGRMFLVDGGAAAPS